MLLKQTFTMVAAALVLHSYAYAADTYKIDPAHTSISFSVRHLSISNVKGSSGSFQAQSYWMTENSHRLAEPSR